MRSNIRVISMVLAVILAFSCLSICASAAGVIKSGIGFVTASALRLRSGPSTDHETLDIAYNGEVAVVLGQEGDWYKVIYNLQEGYMHTDYLSVLDRENAELGYGKVNASYVNLRSGPSTSYNAISMASTGDLVYIIGLNCGWYKVIFGDDICYIRSDYVDLTEIPYENDDSSKSPLFFRGGVSIGVAPSASLLGSKPESSSPSDSDYDSDYDFSDYDSEIGNGMAQLALSFNGYPYVWGGESPSTGFDCSGLVYYVAKCYGYNIPHGSTSQYRYGTYVEKENLVPGDFVFFENTYEPGISHCGIYLGDGDFIHASGSKTGVKINNLNEAYYINHYYGARRMF